MGVLGWYGAATKVKRNAADGFFTKPPMVVVKTFPQEYRMINGLFLFCLALAIPVIFLAMDFSKGRSFLFRRANAGRSGKSSRIHIKL
jgi:hypothetical protein